MGSCPVGAQTGGWNNGTLYFRARDYTYIMEMCSFIITEKIAWFFKIVDVGFFS